MNGTIDQMSETNQNSPPSIKPDIVFSTKVFREGRRHYFAPNRGGSREVGFAGLAPRGGDVCNGNRTVRNLFPQSSSKWEATHPTQISTASNQITLKRAMYPVYEKLHAPALNFILSEIVLMSAQTMRMNGYTWIVYSHAVARDSFRVLWRSS